MSYWSWLMFCFLLKLSVIKFARATGDLASLSDADLKLLALTYTLEEQTYGSAHLRTQPPPVHVARVRHMRERDLPGWGTNVQNLEEWEQLSQEPDNTIEEGSHILGLKRLSIDTIEQGNIAPDEEQKSTIHQDVHMAPSEVENVHCEKNTIRPAHEGKFVSAITEEEQASMMQSHLGSTRGAIHKEEKSEEPLQDMEEQETQDGGDWQRAISRSTRRKYDKRAARAARKNAATTNREVESVKGNQVSDTVSQADGVNSDVICSCTGIDIKDAEETMLDEIDDVQDGTKSEEECPSVSNQDSGSEASWALHSLSQSKVACITADFPMQNVLLQIGLRVVSPNGLQIQQLQRWALKCEACRNVTSDVGRIFCPKCGNGGTLYKVSITIGPNGVVHTGTKRRFNIRGTKYSLPLPKGGREGVSENPILREDQLPKKMLNRKKKASIPDFTSPAELFVMKSGGKEKIEPPLREALAIFSGKRNPNRPRSKQRG
ncbi:hypothetical protein GOP47_0014292 [Adiantum capillus-veneris]|uniref:Uncharacterized protein n=1 Tax=Adiantum capillus-veneris TaxID=13818 RepID=A0A9D4UL80_ADICA|nr:hypothetical protein GOP47_0014292 [Adiantum capillus-veneris]